MIDDNEARRRGLGCIRGLIIATPVALVSYLICGWLILDWRTAMEFIIGLVVGGVIVWFGKDRVLSLINDE